MGVLAAHSERSVRSRAPTLRDIEDFDSWFTKSEEDVAQLAESLVHWSMAAQPQELEAVMQALVEMLSRGRLDRQVKMKPKDVDDMTLRLGTMEIGEEVFHRRSDVRKRCRDLLKKYDQDGAHLSQEDAEFCRALLSYHTRGSAKMQNMTRITVAHNPLHDARTFFIERADGSREDFSFLRCLHGVPSGEMRRQDLVVSAIVSIAGRGNMANKLAKDLDEAFPFFMHRAVSAAYFRNYIRCMLNIAEAIPSIVGKIMAGVVSNLRRLDLAVGGDVSAKDKAYLMDQGEDEHTSQGRWAKMLDDGLVVTFEFLQKHLLSTTSQDFAKEMTLGLLSAFEKLVLVTSRCRYVQFLVFYVAGQSPAKTEAFLLCLLRRAYCHKEQWMRRQLSFAYIASFCARASFLTYRYNLQMLIYICLFLRQHQTFIENMINGDKLHAPCVVLYLTAVNAVCYILTFRGDELARHTDRDGASALSYILQQPGDRHSSIRNEEYCFTHILQSKVNYLGLIDPSVADKFCRSMLPLRPKLSAWLEPPKESRSPLRDPIVKDAGSGVVYPFEPFGLHSSNIFLKFMYRSWDESSQVPAQACEQAGGRFAFDADKEEDSKFFEHLGADMPAPQSEHPAADVPAQQHRAESAEEPTQEEQEEQEDEQEDEGWNVDFVDETAGRTRGFIASVGPSPAFRPQAAPELDDLLEPLSLLDSPALTVVEADQVDIDPDFGFLLPENLPQPNVPEHVMDNNFEDTDLDDDVDYYVEDGERPATKRRKQPNSGNKRSCRRTLSGDGEEDRSYSNGYRLDDWTYSCHSLVMAEMDGL
mmetsp:Transcript_25500/g.58847  ORF Transcript_25500/g.58847 Transcript_25500/m.58847 type:complete len:812 (+) Transcript_25500:52-2487(+)